MQDEELLKILRGCRKGGRQDWPVEAMLNAFYAGLVLQYCSVEFLWRNLADDSTMMRVCGFSLLETAERVECEHGAMCALFNRNRDWLMEACPDFGTSLGFDAKKLHSHSTSRTRADGTCSDPDADWGGRV